MGRQPLPDAQNGVPDESGVEQGAVMSAREALRLYAASLPPGTVVPVPRELVLELLAAQGPEAWTAATVRDLTVPEVAAHFGRSPGTVRAWLEARRFEGAYKLRGKSWRVPPAALSRFVKQQRATKEPSRVGRSEKVVRLDAWRKTG